MPRLRWLWACALVALLSFGLCLGLSPAPAWAEKGDKPQAKPSSESGGGDLGNPFGLFGDDEDEAEQTGKVLEAYEPSGYDYSAIAIERPRSLGIFRSWAYGLLANPALDAYANRVLQRIMAIAPESPLPVKAYILADNAFEAHAAPDGGIFVSLGMLRDLESEDELAFVLAHELAHIIYRHHGKDWYAKTERRALTAASLAHETLAQVEKFAGTEIGATRDFKTGIIVGSLLLEAHTVVLDPAWTRDQEDEADLLGLDMMIAAGYNMAATLTFLETLDIWEKQQEAKNPERTDEEREADMEDALKDQGLGGLFSQAFAELTQSIAEEKPSSARSTCRPPSATRSCRTTCWANT